MKLVPIVDLSQVVLLTPTDVTAGANGTAVDISAYEGTGIVVVAYHKVAGTTPTFDYKLQAGAAANGSDAADIKECKGNDAKITQVTTSTTDGSQVITVDISAIGKYLRGVTAVSGANAEWYASAVLLAQKKYV
jgi:hypothetical protein